MSTTCGFVVGDGCGLSPLLFSIFLELIIATALKDEEIFIQIRDGE